MGPAETAVAPDDPLSGTRLRAGGRRRRHGAWRGDPNLARHFVVHPSVAVQRDVSFYPCVAVNRVAGHAPDRAVVIGPSGSGTWSRLVAGAVAGRYPSNFSRSADFRN